MFRAPTQAGLPTVSVMLDDIPSPLHQVARHLGLKESTLQTYRRTGNAPRSVQLALFWETKWGRSASNTEAVNWAAMNYRDALASKREISRMAGIIMRLEQEIENDRESIGRPANLPIFKTH